MQGEEQGQKSMAKRERLLKIYSHGDAGRVVAQ